MEAISDVGADKALEWAAAVIARAYVARRFAPAMFSAEAVGDTVVIVFVGAARTHILSLIVLPSEAGAA